ncbi:(R)-mandelonitrile lyase 3-like [Malus sylvestris]|uniref:(R)-mandelonitrile lyase 3-like n=1 Tax=Malus sylvestris TaxID=3752 RepID=UPI0021ABAADE|nr:(R)-mandelonitrile lyase 3-like [Malus sylvestris]
MTPINVDDNILKMKAFPFSLLENAQDWLFELAPGTVTSWEKQMSYGVGILEKGVEDLKKSMLDDLSARTKVTSSIFDNHGKRHGAVDLLNNGGPESLRVAVYATGERIVSSSNTSGLNLGVLVGLTPDFFKYEQLCCRGGVEGERKVQLHSAPKKFWNLVFLPLCQLMHKLPNLLLQIL